MNSEFKVYLDEQKQNNAYSSTVATPLLSEAFGTGENVKTKGWVVELDFTKENIVNSIANIIENNPNVDKENDDSIKNAIKNIIYEIILNLSESAKKLKLTLGRFGQAFVGVQSDDQNVISYYFLPAKGKTPEAFAERFIAQIGQNRKTVFLAKSLDATEARFYKNEFDKNSIFYEPAGKKDEILNDNLTKYTTDIIIKTIKETLAANKTRKENGNLINVYSTTYRISDEFITNIAKKEAEGSQSITDFYTRLVNEINEQLSNAIKQINEANKNDFLGIIPLKTAGFNLYFKDRSVAEDIAAVLNQEDNNTVKEWKRYENKMLTLPKSIDITTFRNSTFGIKVVGDLVKDILPGINDQVKVIQYQYEFDDENVKNILDKRGIDSIDKVENGIDEYFKAIYSKLIETHKNQLITILSEKKKLKFIFTQNVTDSGIVNVLANLLYCSENDIRQKTTALTKKEIDDFRKHPITTANFESFSSIVKEFIGAENDEKRKEKTLQNKLIINVEELAHYIINPQTFKSRPIQWNPYIAFNNLNSNKTDESFTNAMYKKLLKTCNLLFESSDNQFNLIKQNIMELLGTKESASLIELDKSGKIIKNIVSNIISFFENKVKDIGKDINEYITIEKDKDNNSITYSYAPIIAKQIEKIEQALLNSFSKNIITLTGVKNLKKV